MIQELTIYENKNNEPIISARELHKALESKKKFSDWWTQQLNYGFEENEDYCLIEGKSPQSDLLKNEIKPFYNEANGRYFDDYALRLDVAKEIAMVSRTQKGKEIRKYFIEVEKQWNDPTMVMARALKMANKTLDTLRATLNEKQLVIEAQEKELEITRPKSEYCDMVLQSVDAVAITIIAKDYGMSAIKMNKILKELGIQYKQGNQWLLYSKYQDKGYTKSHTTYYTKPSGEMGSSINTKWTQKGRLFLYEELKKNNVLPMCEQ